MFFDINEDMTDVEIIGDPNQKDPMVLDMQFKWNTKCDVDGSALMFDSEGNLFDYVAYDHPTSKEEYVKHTRGDNLTGKSAYEWDENIRINITNINKSKVTALVFGVQIYSGKNYLSAVKDLKCRICYSLARKEGSKNLLKNINFKKPKYIKEDRLLYPIFLYKPKKIKELKYDQGVILCVVYKSLISKTWRVRTIGKRLLGYTIKEFDNVKRGLMEVPWEALSPNSKLYNMKKALFDSLARLYMFVEGQRVPQFRKQCHKVNVSIKMIKKGNYSHTFYVLGTKTIINKYIKIRYFLRKGYDVEQYTIVEFKILKGNKVSVKNLVSEEVKKVSTAELIGKSILGRRVSEALDGMVVNVKVELMTVPVTGRGALSLFAQERLYDLMKSDDLHKSHVFVVKGYENMPPPSMGGGMSYGGEDHYKDKKKKKKEKRKKDLGGKLIKGISKLF